MRTVTTTIDNILELIICSRDYGFENDVLFDSFREMLDDKLTDEEIENFARYMESLEGYGEDDYAQIKERLIEFQQKYFKNK